MKLFLLLFFSKLAQRTQGDSTAATAAPTVYHRQDTYQLDNRSTIVQLFEWKWLDIAVECETFLGPKGYGAVQISPPHENLIIEQDLDNRPWWERYQPVSYKIASRSGNQAQFYEMTTRCNNAGVRIYADVVLNHMTADQPKNVGTAGSQVDFELSDYPEVPYHKQHFHQTNCVVTDYHNPNEVRNCKLRGMRDLDQGNDHVMSVIVDYLNLLIDLGVAGFRIDSAKYMWPIDLGLLYMRIDRLSERFFPLQGRPYIYQEVVDSMDNEAVTPQDYLSIGAVTDFEVGRMLARCFRGKLPLFHLKNWGPQIGLLPDEMSLVFVDNHNTQRARHPDGSSPFLSYKEPKAYKAATAFLLAYPYGEPRVMSSYHFNNADQGPPSRSKKIISPTFYADGTCGNGWVCEHRWHQVYHMVAFRNMVKGTEMIHWWDNGNNQVAFSRGDKGFVAFNVDWSDMDERIQCGLPPGTYCDIMSGGRQELSCAGVWVLVDSQRMARVQIPHNAQEAAIAIHVGAESLLPENHNFFNLMT